MTTRVIKLLFALTLMAGCAMRPDDDPNIKRIVEQILSAEGNLHAEQIQVASLNGEVTLRGDVGSTVDRSRAIELAEGVRGVLRVSDKLAVTPRPRDLADFALADVSETPEPNAIRSKLATGEPPAAASRAR